MNDLDDGYYDPLPSQEANNGAQHLTSAHTVEFHRIGGVSASFGAADNVYEQVDHVDQIHGTISLHGFCEQFVRTREFQRLQNLRQLAVANKVFPSACHTRLEHSLGVSHLCLRLLQSLRAQPGAELELEERDVRNVAIAGLCHDLGHGPLSHAFEKEFLRRKNLNGWEHENMSLTLFRRIVDQHGIQDVEEEDMRTIGQLIKGAKPADRAQWPAGKRFLFDIVSNDQNGVDMDRADYMQRDALMCGRIQLACNFEHIINEARVVDDQVCYPIWQLNNVWDVYRERVRLFQNVYTHRRTKAAELMAVDALMAADEALHFSKDIFNPEWFLTLDDGYLSVIQHYHLHQEKTFDLMAKPERDALGRAQKILGRLTVGDVYDCCGECEVPERMLLDGTWDVLANEFTADSVSGYGSGLDKDDVMLDENRTDYGKGGVDPMRGVGFYDGEGASCHRVAADLALLPSWQRPQCYKIRTLRVFVRESENRAAASAAFKAWCRERLGAEAHVKTDMVDERLRRYDSRTTGAAAERVEGPLAQRKASDARRAGAAIVASPSSPLPATPAAKRSKMEEASTATA